MKRYTRFFLAFSLVATGLAFPAHAAEITRAPYLQLATPDSITIVWRTDAPIDPIVRYGKTADTLSNTTTADNALLRVSDDIQASPGVPRLYKEPTQQAVSRKARGRKPDPSTAPGTYQYEITIDKLETNQTYFYAAYDGDTLLAGGDATYYFSTFPQPSSSANQRIWVVGDSGTGGRDQHLVHQAMIDYTAETKRPLDMYIHVGDMAYTDGTDKEFSNRFFDVYDYTLRHTVCWPAMGNHEGHTSRGLSGIGPYYDAYVLPTNAEAGGLPSGTEAYYSYRAGRIHFVCLDSHDLDRRPDGPMAQWLEADLAEADADWVIAFWHHPPYTKGSHDSDTEKQLREMREFIMPILEDGGVDIVLTGHSHIYERSMLMDGAYVTPTTAEGVILDDGDGDPNGDGAYRKSAGLQPHEGTVQIVAGHGGTGLSRRGTMPVMREIILEHGSVILDIDGDTLVGTMVNKEKVVRDVFSIVKRGTVTPQRIEDPWQPEQLPIEMTEIHLDFRKDTIGESPDNFTTAYARNAKFSIFESQDTGRHLIATSPIEGQAALSVYDDFEGDQYEYEIKFQIPKDAKSQTATAVFNYQNPRTYYYILVDAKKNTIELNKMVKGKHARIYRKKQKFNADTWYELEINVNKGKFSIEINDIRTFAKDDADITGHGKIGVRAEPGSSTHYRDIEIEKGG